MDHLKSKVCSRPAFILSKLVCCARRITHKFDHTLLSDRVVPALSLVHQETLHSSRSAPPRARTVHITVSVISQNKVARHRQDATRAAGILEKQDIHSALLDQAPRTHNRTARPALRCLRHAEAAQVDYARTRATLPLPQQAQSCISQPLQQSFPCHDDLNDPTAIGRGYKIPLSIFLCLPTCLTARANSISCLVLDPGRLPRCCWRDIPATQRPRARAWGTTRIPPWRAMSPRLTTRALTANVCLMAPTLGPLYVTSWTATMIDACPITDNILADHFDGRRCAAVGAACEGRILRR